MTRRFYFSCRCEGTVETAHCWQTHWPVQVLQEEWHGLQVISSTWKKVPLVHSGTQVIPARLWRKINCITIVYFKGKFNYIWQSIHTCSLRCRQCICLRTSGISYRCHDTSDTVSDLAQTACISTVLENYGSRIFFTFNMYHLWISEPAACLRLLPGNVMICTHKLNNIQLTDC